MKYNKFDRGIARLLGFRAVDPQWVARLPRLNGIYGPSKGVIVDWSIVCGVWAVLAIAIFWQFAANDDWDAPSPGQILMAGAGLVLFLLMLWLMHRRIRTRYEFRGLTLTCVNPGGRIAWKESLEDLQIVTGEEAVMTRLPSIRYITLHWVGHKRRIILHESLKHALDASVAR